MEGSEKLSLETAVSIEQSPFVVILAAVLSKRLAMINQATLLDSYMVCILLLVFI